MSIKTQINSGLEVAVAHLNAPYGKVVDASHLRDAIRQGKIENASFSPSVEAIINTVFVELSPALIFKCVRESGATLRQANALYLDTIRHSAPRVVDWEQSVAYLT